MAALVGAEYGTGQIDDAHAGGLAGGHADRAFQRIVFSEAMCQRGAIFGPNRHGITALKLALNDRFEGVHNLVESSALDAIATTVFGGIVNAISIHLNKHGLEKLEAWDQELDKVSAEGAKMGLEVAVKELTRSQRTVKALLG